VGLFLNMLLKDVLEGIIVGLLITAITTGAKKVGSCLLIIRERKNSRKNRENLHKRE
jgi:hypothetical protein